MSKFEHVISQQKVIAICKKTGAKKYESRFSSWGWSVRDPYREHDELEIQFSGGYDRPEQVRKDVIAIANALTQNDIPFRCYFRGGKQWDAVPEFCIRKDGQTSKSNQPWDEDAFQSMMDRMDADKKKEDQRKSEERARKNAELAERERRTVALGHSLNPSLSNNLGNSTMHVVEVDRDGHSGMLQGTLNVQWTWGNDTYTAKLHCMVTWEQRKSFLTDGYEDTYALEISYMFRNPARENRVVNGRSSLSDCKTVTEGMLYFAGDFRP